MVSRFGGMGGLKGGFRCKGWVNSVIIYTVSHRSEYTPYIFVNILLYFPCDNTEEMTLWDNVK